ncbi:MAG: AtpZ/AtpI family protein [Calditrichaeota bacterium]|nr:MAG: AtpZ/AtpI family protein [Calditrichota bacterium]
MKKPPEKQNKSAQKNTSKNIESLGEAYRKAAPYLNVGTVWFLSVLIFTWIGIKLDERWDTTPWLTVAGAVIGVVSGFYHFIKTVMQEDKSNKPSP